MTIFSVLLLVFSICITVSYISDKECRDKIWILVLSFVLLIIGFFGINHELDNERKEIRAYEETYFIKSISLNFETEGRFFILGSGYINEKAVYYFYIFDEVEKGYRLMHVDCEHSIIFEIDTSINPYVVLTKDIDERGIIYTIGSIYIPEGSIIENYNPN